MNLKTTNAARVKGKNSMYSRTQKGIYRVNVSNGKTFRFEGTITELEAKFQAEHGQIDRSFQNDLLGRWTIVGAGEDEIRWNCQQHA
jgi:hypothetical protein